MTVQLSYTRCVCLYCLCLSGMPIACTSMCLCYCSGVLQGAQPSRHRAYSAQSGCSSKGEPEPWTGESSGGGRCGYPSATSGWQREVVGAGHRDFQTVRSVAGAVVVKVACGEVAVRAQVLHWLVTNSSSLLQW